LIIGPDGPLGRIATPKCVHFIVKSRVQC